MAGPTWKQVWPALLRALPEIALRLALNVERHATERDLDERKDGRHHGATSGVGLATAILLAERGAEVVMVGRDRTRANFMRTEIAQYASGNEPILFLADLSSQAEIHRLAEKLHGSLSRIRCPDQQCGCCVRRKEEVTPDGLEKTFAVITLRRSR